MSASLSYVVPPPLVAVEDLHLAFGAGAEVVKGISFHVGRGECLALVGESGSGKSVTARTLVGLTGPGARLAARRLEFDGGDLRRFDEADWRGVRGGRIGFVMQDALGSLDPLRIVGREIEEALRLHTDLDRERRRVRAVELLRSVGVPEPAVRARQHPWELSGGLRQRALIASAIACGPQLLIADEPTTALDALVQAQVLDLLESLRREDASMLLVSHDFSVVARLADRVAVMKDGEIVEQGSVEQVLEAPRHDYTKSLLAAARSVHNVDWRPAPVAAPARMVIEARDLTKSFVGPGGRRRRAVRGVSFVLRAGETLGIVGESGSGKTTTKRLLLGLEEPDRGGVSLQGRPWSDFDASERRAARRRIQVVFQDPLASFDPRYTVERVLGEALAVAGHRGEERRRRALALLDLVRLGPCHLGRRPLELSGGQRQRVALARALAAEPEVLICDEPVSALDVSVQAQILDLLQDLKARLGLSCIFISHDLGIVRRVSDRVLVMKDGQVVEEGAVDEVFANPRHDYTRALLTAIPRVQPAHTERRRFHA